MNGSSGGAAGGTGGTGAGTSSSVRASYGAVYVNPVNGHLGPSPRQMPSASNSLQGALSSISKTSSTGSATGASASAGGGGGGGGGPPIDHHHQRTIHPDLTTTSSLQPSPPVHLVADGPGPAKMVANLFDLDKEMQRQLEDYNRSIILVIWYKAHTNPLRIQHINTTFPYFQLAQVQAVVQDLALGHSYIDTYDPTTCAWEQHTVGNVRLVSKQQRLLYRVRKSLLEGLDEAECPGLGEEVGKQTLSAGGVKLELPLETHHQQQQQHSLKRPHQETSSSPLGPPTKVRITEAPMGGGGGGNFIPDPTSSLSPTSTLTHTPMSLQQSLPPPAMSQLSSPPTAPSTLSLAPSPSLPPQQRYYPAPPIPVAPALSHHSSTQSNPSTRGLQQTPHTSAPPLPPPSASNAPTASPVIPTTAPPQANTVTLSEVQAPPPSASSASPPLTYTPLVSSQPPAPIPHHPHPPLKRWPNDYTVGEISRGFDAMDSLVRNGLPPSPGGPNSSNSTNSSSNGGQGQGITQKLAFERVFGSRYVKSTVCRHRGLWRRADQKLKEQFEKMGGDERAVWGEFVKRVEGRAGGGGGTTGSTGATGGSNGGSTSSSGRQGSGKHDNIMFEQPLGAAPQQQVRSTSGRDDKTKKKAMDNEPVMASL